MATKKSSKQGVASPQLQALVGSKKIGSQQARKKFWDYVKKKGLQDKKDGRKINLDSTLKSLVGGNKKQISMFDVAKVISKHLTVEVEEKKPTYASRELAAVVGNKQINMKTAVKKIWAYVKRKGLQDKKDGRKINLDSTLKSIVGGSKKQISMFEVAKVVSKHLVTK